MRAWFAINCNRSIIPRYRKVVVCIGDNAAIHSRSFHLVSRMPAGILSPGSMSGLCGAK